MNRHQAEGFVRDRNTGEDEVLIDGWQLFAAQCLLKDGERRHLLATPWEDNINQVWQALSCTIDLTSEESLMTTVQKSVAQSAKLRSQRYDEFTARITSEFTTGKPENNES